MEDSFPSIDVLISDAVALGYSVYAMIVDEDNNARYVSNNKQGEGFSFDNEKWKNAMENIHGGPITSIEDILQEEERHRNKLNNEGYSEIDELDDPDEIESWIEHYKSELFDIENGESEADDEFKGESYTAYLREFIAQLESKAKEFEHDTWFDPSEPDAITDSPCYCGWLGLNQPPPEFAPPNCSCISNIEPNHGHDLGYIKFQEKKLEDEG